MRRTTSDEQKRKIIELYQNGLNCKQIARYVDIHPSTVERHLKKNNIQPERYRNRRYVNHELNHNYFENMDTEEVIYYLGFIFADGNIYKPSNPASSWRLNIEIHEKDIEILNNFNINNIIKYNKKKKTVRMEISSNPICASLQRLGVFPNKSLTCEFPHILSYDLISHFIRGYFDGDGGFYFNTKTNRLITYIYGTRSFLETLGKHLPCEYSIRNVKKIAELRVSTKKEEVKKFIDYLYKDSRFLLKRKFDKTLLLQFN